MDIQPIEAALTRARVCYSAADVKARTRCYCESNSYEHRGACNYHVSRSVWSDVVKKGEELLKGPMEILVIEGPDFVRDVQRLQRSYT
jgi:hypothetical protein